MLALSVSLVLCDHPGWGWLVFTGAIVASVVGSYSGFQGLLIWPAGLVILLLRRRSPLYWLAWIVIAALATALYFVNYNRLFGSSDNYVLNHPIEGLRFFLFSVGNVFLSHGGDVAVVLGILIVGTASSLTTTLANGKNDAAVKGVVVLIAFAQGDYGVAKVHFEILGPSGSRELVNAGDTEYYGWIGSWDTTPLPNGRYRVRSVAHDHASDRATSLPVTVNIENEPG